MNATIERWPVIVGIGESRQRSKDLSQALEPLELMAQALEAAQADAGCAVLPQVDKLCVIQEFSWPYADAPGLLAQRLSMPATTREYGPVGGETPIRFLHECALAIARGEAEVAAVVGAEAQYSVNAARAHGVDLPWSPRDDDTPLVRGAIHQHPLARQWGVATPATAYPLFEQAAQAKWGLTPAQAQLESAQLWAGLSAAAAANPMAWDQRLRSAARAQPPTDRSRTGSAGERRALVPGGR
jgi:acetyl-CoA acetyltransferase